MTTHNRDKVIAALKEAGAIKSDFGEVPRWVERFYAIAFKDGRQAEREDCAKVCESIDSLASSNPPMLCAKAIRARGDTK